MEVSPIADSRPTSPAPSRAPSGTASKNPDPRTPSKAHRSGRSSRAASSRRNAETRFPISPQRGRSRIQSFGEISHFAVGDDDDDEPPLVANTGNSPMLGQQVSQARMKRKAVPGKVDQDVFETVDLGKGKARETDEQGLGVQADAKESKTVKAKEAWASVKNKLRHTKEVKDAEAPSSGLGIFQKKSVRPDPAHRELRLGHPTEQLDVEAQAVRRSREIWSGWQVAQAVSMMLTVITFILSAATMWAVNHHQ